LVQQQNPAYWLLSDVELARVKPPRESFQARTSSLDEPRQLIDKNTQQPSVTPPSVDVIFVAGATWDRIAAFGRGSAEPGTRALSPLVEGTRLDLSMRELGEVTG
ncbi:MAG: hypothetical protein AAFU85_26835, partial [Planctomycetota bacterium]